MLHLSSPLFFPSLHRFGETTFKSWSDSPQKTTDLFTVDWDRVDTFKKEQFYKHARTSSSQFPGTMPAEYDEWVRTLTFAIPTRYLEETRKNARKAQTEWSANYPFDTDIREMCLEPAIAHIYVAFRLLADCIYDPATNYFSRDTRKILASQAMLYKFWAFQTGRGNVQRHSRFDKITWMVDDPALRSSETGEVIGDDSHHYQVRKFIAAIKEYEENVECLYKQAPVEGPSIEVTNVTVSSGGVSTNVYPATEPQEIMTTGTPSSAGPVELRPKNRKTPVNGTNSDISVIIFSSDQNSSLEKNLASLIKYGFQDVIVVDEGSAIPVEQCLAGFERYKDVHVIRVAKGISRDILIGSGLLIAKGKYILFLSPEVRVKGFDYDISGQWYFDPATKSILCPRENAHLDPNDLPKGYSPFRTNDLIIER